MFPPLSRKASTEILHDVGRQVSTRRKRTVDQSSRVKEVKHQKKNKRHWQAPGDPGIHMTGKYRQEPTADVGQQEKKPHERHQVRMRVRQTHHHSRLRRVLNGPYGRFFSDVGRFSSPRDERAGGPSDAYRRGKHVEAAVLLDEPPAVGVRQLEVPQQSGHFVPPPPPSPFPEPLSGRCCQANATAPELG